MALLSATATGSAAPLTIAASGHPVAPVSVDEGRPAAFIIDTGAEGSAVYRWFAESRHLPEAGEERLDGQTGAATLPMRQVQTMAIDRARSRPLQLVELADQPDRRDIAGVLGLDVMRGSLVEFDFAHRRVLFHEHAMAGRLRRSLGKPIHATKVTGGLLAIPVVLNGTAGMAVIDTGARESRANEAFAARASLAPLDVPLRAIRGANDKAAQLRTAQVRTMRLSNQNLGATTIKVADLSIFETFGWADSPAMLLGFDHLRRFRLVVDADRGEIWLARPRCGRSERAPGREGVQILKC
ncbi:aspartyl protease family protein [Sphingomonas metalli]|uniref:aspartyl protease family protein n=1 Tax=Sphingomonas metalli TaxID=1779358 RepID=UPI001666D13B|nr:aspartyl protease family protein [Sphingomonas metalli]